MIWLPFTHSLNTNGPVPTGLLPRSLPNFFAAVGEIMKPGRSPSRLSRPGERCFRLNATVAGSITSTDAMIGSSCWRCGEATSLSSRCSMFHFTASALKSVPSWNFTPLRSLKTMRLPSPSMFQLSASSGWSEKSVP